MNKAGINNDDLVLVRQQVASQNGDIVVAIVDDEATVKRMRKSGNTYLLCPESTDASYKPIVVDERFRILGIVTSVLSGIPET